MWGRFLEAWLPPKIEWLRLHANNTLLPDCKEERTHSGECAEPLRLLTQRRYPLRGRWGRSGAGLGTFWLERGGMTSGFEPFVAASTDAKVTARSPESQ